MPELDFRHLGLAFTDGLCDWPINDNGRRHARWRSKAICRLIAPTTSAWWRRVAACPQIVSLPYAAPRQRRR